MSESRDRLYALLPAVHRMRDAQQGYPLRALLGVISEQVDVVEGDIAQLYDNWFIETCDDWVVPYIGDLIGYRPVHETAPAARDGDVVQQRPAHALVPRREVANTLGYRRRKGTIALLEVLANDIAGWPARAVEFYQFLAWSQHLNHLRPERGGTLAFGDVRTLELLGGPFETTSHTVDVRRVNSQRAVGRYNIPSVGVLVWRLRSYPVSHAPACCIEGIGPNCFTFNALCADTPLYNKPRPESDPTQIAQEINLPTPIRRRGLEERISLRPLKTQVAADYYGEGKSLTVWAPDWPTKDAPQPVSREHMVPADLSDWRYRASRGQLGVDPVRGRLVFPTGQLPKRGVWVSYHYAFSADMGGGEYQRELSQPAAHSLYLVNKDAPASGVHETINSALEAWRADQLAIGPKPADPDELRHWTAKKERLRSAVIQITDSAVYSEPITISLEAGESLQIRAANRKRPMIRLLDYMTERPDALAVSGKQGSRFKLDGLIVSGRGLQVVGPDRNDPDARDLGDLCDVRIRHCTLVPGWGLEPDCEPRRPNEPSLEVLYSTTDVLIEHSIIGSIEVVADEVQTDPVSISISDSIIDATSPDRIAVGAANLPLGFALLSLIRCTVIGEVNVHAIEVADDSIFMGKILVARRQLGCMRFCYVVPGSRTPRRYHCQPDMAVQASEQALRDMPRRFDQPPLSEIEISRAKARAQQRVQPQFSSLRYGAPAYCQLSLDCADEIRRGAEDESEMGAFHDLYQPQREANLRARLEEYTPAGMDAGILFVN
jgi:hypothetical protein